MNMKRTQLLKLGLPDSSTLVNAAIQGVHLAAKADALRDMDLDQELIKVINAPQEQREHPYFSQLALALIEHLREPQLMEPISYQTWGEDIDTAAHAQMKQACSLPSAVGAALMPDAHVGYGLPIGGVLALRDAVCPYAVGVDIACRMKLSVLDFAPDKLVSEKYLHLLETSLEKGTRFGVGAEFKQPLEHPVMDQDWSVTRITRENKTKAWKQLGTSGSGNHFVEFGLLTLTAPAEDLGLPAGTYTALLSHSGSRGTGASVCQTYSQIAQARLPERYKDLGRLAWLDMASEAGQEYWAAMNLMGDYAAANHACIHRNVVKLLGAEVIAGVENHHNFAWLEEHQGERVYVHRKGATPAGKGVLGVIPGSMADPGFVVRGLGNDASLHSASHGAGRCMSRTQANNTYNFKAVKNDLLKRGVRILSAGADEVPGAYKNIETVMAAQRDLVEIVARFDPKLVKMCGDGSKAED
jgi:tRNA-splicing ligase RtcB (3'-phosphate/5'-hydroxy nucleic acid ligase)